MYTKPYKKKFTPSNQKFWRVNNWQMWIFCILLVVVFFPLFRYIRNQLQKNKEQNAQLSKESVLVENSNPIIAQTKANKITPRVDIQAAAKSLSVDFGVKFSDNGNWYDFLNPRGWTENDSNITKTLIYQRKNFKLLETLYYSIYTNSRSLRDDILKLLDATELAKLRKYIKI